LADKNTNTAFYAHQVATRQVMADLDHLDVRATSVHTRGRACHDDDSVGSCRVGWVGQMGVLANSRARRSDDSWPQT
jgi:hypothetical protein